MTAAILFLVLGSAFLWLCSLAAWALLLRSAWRCQWGAALLLAYPFWWVAQLLVTKTLGQFEAITPRALFMTTLLLGAIPFISAVVLKRRRGPVEEPLRAAEATRPSVGTRFRTALRSYWPEGIAILYVAICGFKAALVYPSRVWDTLTYHLPIIANWLQQGSLAPWTTASQRQIARTGGAEFQRLWVVGPPRADLLVELPSLLAGVIAVVFVREVARRWGAVRAVALAAGLSVFAAPQVFWSAVSAKDDLVMTAALLCALYNAICCISERRPGLATMHAAAAAVSACLTCATKPPGLLFGGIFIALLSLFLLKMRMWKRLMLVVGLFGLVGLATFGLQYLWNLQQYGSLFPEMAGGPRTKEHPSGRIALSGFRFFRFVLVEGATGVGTEHDVSNFGLWLPLFVLPLAFLTNWRAFLAAVKGDWKTFNEKWSREQIFILLYAVAAIGIFLAVHPFGRWDQRFLIWLIPLVIVLSVRSLERFISPTLFRVVALAFTLLTVRTVMALGYRDAAKPWELTPIKIHLGAREVPGYAALHAAQPGDTVLYVGAEDTAIYPCWGWRFDRVVWAADSLVTLRNYFDRSPRWVVLEISAPEDLRAATSEFLSAQGYTKVSEEPPEADELPDSMRRTIWRR